MGENKIDFWGPEGILAGAMEGYEARSSQVKMAKAVEWAMAGGGHLVVEGPTGVGKSLAYLVPAILNARRREAEECKGEEPGVQDERDGVINSHRVVVATANIALQEQLFQKDLPFLDRILPGGVKFALVKGHNNYLCLHRLDMFRVEKAQLDLEFGANVAGIGLNDILDKLNEEERKIVEWAQTTEIGDKSELSFVPDNRVWQQFSIQAEDCIGRRCEKVNECLAKRAKVALVDKHVIVVNYHLLLAAVKVRMEADGKDIVLPPFKYLVCDEAHKLADIARSFLGWELSYWSVQKQISGFKTVIDWAKTAGLRGEAEGRFRGIVEEVEEGRDNFTASLDEHYGHSKGPVLVETKGDIQPYSLAEAMEKLAVAYTEIAKLPLPDRDLGEIDIHKKRAVRVRDILREVGEPNDPGAVYFLEKAGKKQRVRLVKRLLDVSDLLWDSMFQRTASTIITSATLATGEGRSCGYVRKEIGMKSAKELVVDSPFDFLRQAAIVLSGKAPDPTQQDYPDLVAKTVAHIIGQADGRTLGLFTSYRVLRVVSEYVKANANGYQILTQGEAPRGQLIAEFKRDVSSVLLGTESFWAGVDVPGEALSCLVIDKIPFPAPGDPVMDKLASQCTGNPFWEYSVPRAVLQFRQGAGRLIRRSDDRGAIVVLDRRLVTKGYGPMFINSLPRMTVLDGLRGGRVRQWLEAENG